MKLFHGDCLDILKTLPDNCVDSVVTDPPYGLSFMGKKWDYDVPPVEVWVECLRVLKPGGHLLAFAGTRTQHRMAVRIEDAGFEIRDMIAWVYGSGFPKSHNLDGEWEGWGTALKPALEPITVARKPLVGTVAANVQVHGTGALNIDSCRIATGDTLRIGSGGIPCRHDEHTPRGRANEASADRCYADTGSTNFAMTPGPRGGDPSGRWPANLIHDGSPAVLAAFPDAPGQQGKVTGMEPTANGFSGAVKYSGMLGRIESADPRGDAGSAARFFYCAKASKADRDEGLEDFGLAEGGIKNGSGRGFSGTEPYKQVVRANTHPTVKPTELMRYLLRLVTPPGGVPLDPYMGSGSTGKAAALDGFGFIGIERDEHYFAIAKARIEVARRQPDLFKGAA